MAKLKTASWCCNVDMGESCIHTKVAFPDGKVYDRHPLTGGPRPMDAGAECGDCGTIASGDSYHHSSCDKEMCPRCGGQMLCCDCKDGRHALTS